MAASGGSRFHSRESVIPSAIPVSLYGLEAVLLARSHQRGFWRATGYRAQVPGAPAPPTSTCMFMPGSSSGVESRRALLARLVPCLRSHIAFWTVRLRRREPSTFRGNDWRACLRLRRDQIARTLGQLGYMFPQRSVNAARGASSLSAAKLKIDNRA